MTRKPVRHAGNNGLRYKSKRHVLLTFIPRCEIMTIYSYALLSMQCNIEKALFDMISAREKGSIFNLIERTKASV